MTGLLDTNIALYLLGGRLAAPLPAGDYGISVVTEMELLSWPSLTTAEETRVRAFINSLILCEMTAEVRARAIELRRTEALKLPDAVVCATALVHRTELWTNDARLARVAGLVCRSAALNA